MAEELCLILMATYNGEKYIRDQIESIISQNYQNWNLLIRDDGSTDNTIQIIQEFASNDNRIELLINKDGNHGAYVNFWSLINEAKHRKQYKYYFFSDQDDIWPENRMANMIDVAAEEQNLPTLVYGDMQIVDDNGSIIFKSLNEIMGIGEMSGWTEFYSSGFVWGCNALINDKLFQTTPVYPINEQNVRIMSHDNYYTKFALITGKVKFLDQVCILHRRHRENTTGNYELKLSLKKIFKKALLNYQQVARTHALGYAQTINTIYKMHEVGLDNDIVTNIERAILKGGLYGVGILFKQKVKRKQISRTFGIYIIMLFKSYKKYMNEYLNL